MSCQEMTSHEVSGQERSGNYEVMKCKVQGRFFKLFQILWTDLLCLFVRSCQVGKFSKDYVKIC